MAKLDQEALAQIVTAVLASLQAQGAASERSLPRSCARYPTLLTVIGMSALCQKQRFCVAVESGATQSPRRRGLATSLGYRCQENVQFAD
jgi:hypothetical protein